MVYSNVVFLPNWMKELFPTEVGEDSKCNFCNQVDPNGRQQIEGRTFVFCEGRKSFFEFPFDDCRSIDCLLRKLSISRRVEEKLLLDQKDAMSFAKIF